MYRGSSNLEVACKIVGSVYTELSSKGFVKETLGLGFN